jgi:hypothetical protein
MAKGYSKDLRVRVLAFVEAGESAREAARLLNIGASTAIRWIERWTTTGSVDAKPGTFTTVTISPSKKRCAAEQERPDIAAGRAALKAQQAKPCTASRLHRRDRGHDEDGRALRAFSLR